MWRVEGRGPQEELGHLVVIGARAVDVPAVVGIVERPGPGVGGPQLHVPLHPSIDAKLQAVIVRVVGLLAP